jgi:hypothetical protein
MKNTKTNVGSFASANLKTVSYKLIAVIAFVTVIGFSFTACGDGGSSPAPKPVEKQIQISDIPKSVYTTGGLSYANYKDFDQAVSLVPPGTALTDPTVFMSKLVAFGGYKGAGEDKAIEDPRTTWIWLYNTDGSRWTGTGTYDVYYVIVDVSDFDKLTGGDMSVAKAIYKAPSVSFTIANTEVKWNDTFGKNKIN